MLSCEKHNTRINMDLFAIILAEMLTDDKLRATADFICRT